MPMADQFWGDRGGSVTDPAGYSWWIATRKEDLTHAEISSARRSSSSRWRRRRPLTNTRQAGQVNHLDHLPALCP